MLDESLRRRREVEEVATSITPNQSEFTNIT
jgi:hypothetical protein